MFQLIRLSHIKYVIKTAGKESLAILFIQLQTINFKGFSKKYITL